jgi:hypothetical protein
MWGSQYSHRGWGHWLILSSDPPDPTRIYKEFKYSIVKKSNYKWAIDLNRHFSKESIQIESKS